MSKKNYLIIPLAFLLFIPSIISAQGKTILDVQIFMGNEILKLNTIYTDKKNDSIEINALRFYISKLEFFEGDKRVWSEENSYHLIDHEDNLTEKISLNIPSSINYDRIKFMLGIDSMTNVSGAMGGDLDPTKGMYWTWQNGYINAKIEGKSPVCPSKKNEFQLHLGGYNEPFVSMQEISLVVKKWNLINLILRVDEFFQGIDLRAHHHIMSPSIDAKICSEKLAKTIHIKE